MQGKKSQRLHEVIQCITSGDSIAYLFVPTASISSMKTIEGERSSATLKSSLTSFGPSPKYFCINSLPTTRKNVADVEFATA